MNYNLTEKEKAAIIKYLLTSDDIVREFEGPMGHYEDHKDHVVCYFPDQKDRYRFSVHWNVYHNSVSVAVCVPYTTWPALLLASRFVATDKKSVAAAAKFFMASWEPVANVSPCNETEFPEYLKEAKIMHKNQMRADELAAAAAEDPDMRFDAGDSATDK